MTETVPDFTVVIPTYNYGAYLARAVESVHAQTGPTREIVVIDDGSTDDTPAVAARLASKITYVRQPNSGVAVARNAGIERARGRYIVFLDADDRLADHALEHFHQAAVEHPEAVTLLGGYCSIGVDGIPVPKRSLPRMTTPAENFRRYVCRDFTIASGMAAVRRNALGDIRFPSGVTNGEDVVFFGQLLAWHPCWSFPAVVVEMFDHAARARRDFSRHLQNGTKTVDALFQPGLLPETALKLRPVFASRWLLSLARAALQGGDRQTARACYLQVLRQRGQELLNLKQLGRLVRACWPGTGAGHRGLVQG